MKHIIPNLATIACLAGCLALLMPSLSEAQQAQLVRKPCLTDEHFAAKLAANPDLLTAKNRFESSLATLLRNAQVQRTFRGPIRIIPTVVHIVHKYNYGNENVSKAAVLANIATLNRDMGRHNADTIQTRAIFADRGAAIGLEFRLATIDPDGNPTDGVTRVESHLTSSPVFRDSVKYTRDWDPTKYFNIWVVEGINDPNASPNTYVAGYAQFPYDTDINTWGLVVDAQNVNGSDRTMSHEVGHCFGLYHPFQDGCSAGPNANDGVADTPPNDQAHIDCDIRNSCHLDSPDEPDMNENIMGYNTCTVMYTVGQANRTEAAIAALPRLRALASANNLAATGTDDPYLPVDGAPIAHFSATPQTACAGSNFSLRDNSYNASKTPDWTYTWIVRGSSTARTYTGQTPTVHIDSVGTWPITLIVTNPQGADTLTRVLITTLPSTGAVAVSPGNPVRQGFENPAFPIVSADSTLNYRTDVGWERTTVAKYEGTASLRIRNYGLGVVTRSIYVPSIDASTIAQPKVYFQRAHVRRSAAATQDKLVFYTSVDCGKTWLLKGSRTDIATTNPLYTVVSYQSSSYTPGRNDWRLDSIGLGGGGQRNIRMRIDMVSDNGNYLYLDDIQIGASYTPFVANKPRVACGNCLSLLVSPNPGTGASEISYKAKDGRGTLTITDQLGRAIGSVALPGTEGAMPISALAPNLANGVYLLRLSSTEGVVVERIVLQSN